MSEFGEYVAVDGWTDFDTGEFYPNRILNCPLQVVRIECQPGARFAIKDPDSRHCEDWWVWEDGLWTSINGSFVYPIGAAGHDAGTHPTILSPESADV